MIVVGATNVPRRDAQQGRMNFALAGVLSMKIGVLNIAHVIIRKIVMVQRHVVAYDVAYTTLTLMMMRNEEEELD
jgi:hypothetical protein